MRILKILLYSVIMSGFPLSQILAQEIYPAESGSAFEQKGSHFVIIGAFQSLGNANKLANEVVAYSLQPKIDMNSPLRLYYVYVFASTDKEAAVNETLRIRSETPYKDAWVFHGPPADPVVEPEVVQEEEEVIPEEPVVVETPQIEEPLEEAIRTLKDEIANLKPGQSVNLNNIHFLPDSDILDEAAQEEVRELLAVMLSNPNLKIRIHGHTNGNDAGIIRQRDPNNPDFFEDRVQKSSRGSAKQLSELRAKTVSDFLTTNGIDPKRMKIKGWGGKKPLFKTNDSQNSMKNLRVEIEVTEV